MCMEPGITGGIQGEHALPGRSCLGRVYMPVEEVYLGRRDSPRSHTRKLKLAEDIPMGLPRTEAVQPTDRSSHYNYGRFSYDLS